MPNEPTPTPVAATPPEEPRRPDPLAAAVAEGVVRLRREAGLSERAAARKLGTSQTQLRRMEDPRYLPSLRSLQRVALAYGYKLSVAFEHEDAVAKRAAPAKEPKPKRAATRGSASPSKGRRASPGRGRGGARRAPRRAAQRRRARSG
ncbi:MAG: helix-turn-helix transcriptional regulator [Chloroflexi bacterium]|nr:MAG: helix-turn-helix transcriptional regulator [Chloroflexota bacterium]